MADSSEVPGRESPNDGYFSDLRSNIFYRQRAKRAFDLVLTAISLPFLAPLIDGLYVGVRLDGGPGFFGHSRVGRDGAIFRCWKLRTMVPDAQQRLEAL